MSRLDKMLIQGVRSFGPDEQMIAFGTPMTLILGQNGCGKTTIIEALKVATCGEFPPGSNRGQLFVHDPKCASQSESKAQIKLLAHDTKGDTISVTRNFQTTQTARLLKFKTLDQTITITGPDNQPRAASSRCVDVDLQMSWALGVSKSILNYVIFCHQEESSWPLEEPKKLKEKFDEIFDSTRYNKCMDRITQMRKDMKIRVALLKKDMDNYKERNEEAASKRSQVRDFERQINISRDQAQALAARIEPINARLDVVALKENNVMKLNTERVTKQTQLDSLRQQQRELKENIGYVFPGSTAELEEAIRSFQSQLQEKERSLGKLTEKMEQLVQQENRFLKSISAEQHKLGQLQGEEDANKARVDARNLNLGRIARDLEMEATQSTQLGETQVNDLMSRVQRKMAENHSEMEAFRVQLELEEQDLQNQIDALRDQKSKLELGLEKKREEAARARAETRKVKTDIDEVNMSAGKLVALENSLARAEREVDETSKAVDVAALKRSIEEAQSKRIGHEERLVIVDKEVKYLHQQSSVQAELDAMQQAKTQKEQELKRLRSKHEDTLKHLLKTVPEQGFKYELQACQDKLARDIKDLNNRLGSKHTEMTRLEMNRIHQKDQLRTQEEELSVKKEAIYEQCGSRPFEEVVQSISEQITNLQDQTGTLSSSHHMVRRYIQKLKQSDPSCPVCHRGFASDREATELVDELTVKMREMPGKLRTSKEQLEAMSKTYDRLQQMKPTSDKLAQLGEVEIPKLRADLKSTEEKLGRLRQEVEELESSLMEPQLDEEMARGVQGDVVLMDQLHADVKQIARRIEATEATLPAGASTRGMNQALSEQEQLRTDISAARSMCDAYQTRLTSHTERLQQLKERRNKLQEDKFKIQGGVAQRKQLEDRLAELQTAVTAAAEEVDRLEAEVGPARTKLEAAVRGRDQARTRNRETVDNSRTKLSDLQKRIDEVAGWQRGVDEYNRRGGGGKMAAVQAALGRLEREREAVRHDKEEQSSRIESVTKELSTQQVRERELKDNLVLREKQEAETRLAAEVAELATRLGDLDYQSIKAEKARLNAELEVINADKSRVEGRRNALEESVGVLNRELRKDIYKNAESNYLKVFGELTVENLAHTDLHRFSNAMAWALMRFHEDRMKSVNQIVRELWRQIYRGNDIDFIEIKTESSQSATSDKRRVYKYRVVQMKGEAELDMRGRCSAGQKVLACLIIRIALAETFSTSCGIFALDEPTTNLDKENIESLSNALIELVNSRMAQKNFQLVVITHDEEFLEGLTKVERIRHYYKVSRNQQGKSVINKLKVMR